MTKLTREDFENFWIQVYLNPSKDFIEASVKRAYQDFNRTLHKISKNQTKDSYEELKDVMIEIVKDLQSKEFETQKQFDDWHESSCAKLKKAFKKIVNHDLYVGQAQKWINMSLKYLFILGDRVENIKTNYRFFHIPVDNIILEKFKMKFKTTWSRVDDYQEYLLFQKKCESYTSTRFQWTWNLNYG